MERTWPDSISFSPSSRICWWEKYWLLKLRVSPWQPSGNTRATATIHHLTGKEKWELNYWKAMTSIIKNDSSAIIYLFRMGPDETKMRRKGLFDWDTRSCVTRGTADWTGEQERPPSPLGPISSSSSSWRRPASGKSCFPTWKFLLFSVNWDMRIQRMLLLGGRAAKKKEKAWLMPSYVGKDNCVDYYSFESENIKLPLEAMSAVNCVVSNITALISSILCEAVILSMASYA